MVDREWLAAPARRRAALLAELAAGFLCIWTALYQTPFGALARAAMSLVRGDQAPPLLADFHGGLYRPLPVERAAPRGMPPTAPRALPPPIVPRALPPDSALCAGLARAAAQLTPRERAMLEAWATVARVDARAIAAGSARDREACAAIIRQARGDFADEEALVLALFCGAAAVHYAEAQARAAGKPPTLESLAAVLPPGFEGAAAAAADTLMMATAYALDWPVPLGTKITSFYGVREHPVWGAPRLHAGIDLALADGSDVRAAADGVVRRASEDALYGRVLVIMHGRGVTTLYCHNQDLLVHAGERVLRGQIIAKSGRSGLTTGPHLHYQVELGGRPVDPLGFRP